MNATRLTAVGLLGAATLTAGFLHTQQSPVVSNTENVTRRAAQSLALPLAFEANRGQAAAAVNFTAHGPGYRLHLTPVSAAMLLNAPAQPTAHLRLRLLGATDAAAVRGEEKLRRTANYILGSDPAAWHTNIETFGRVRYANVYRGIDLVYYGNAGQLEYDFVVAPGADPSPIRLAFDGAHSVQINEAGELVLQTRGGTVKQHKPVIYQNQNGQRVPVSGGYEILPDNTVRFWLGRYDKTQTLVIDPVVDYASYLGGSDYEQTKDAIAVDAAGNVVVACSTNSRNFPLFEAFDNTAAGTGIRGSASAEGTITKFDASGQPVFSTYIGGSGGDAASSVAFDSKGNIVVVGYTNSNDFPLKDAFQGRLQGDVDKFVLKLNPTGSALLFSSYLGGSGHDNDNGLDGTFNDHVILDAKDNIYLSGSTQSKNYPVVNAYQSELRGASDACLTKIKADGSEIIYSTYLGGRGDDGVFETIVDKTGAAYIAGKTNSTDFPTLNAFQPRYGGGIDHFVTKLNAEGNDVEFSSYLGGSGEEEIGGIALDGTGNVYIVGETHSANFPLLKPLKAKMTGNTDGFLLKLSPKAEPLLSTFWGGSATDALSDIALDSTGNIYLTGTTTSPDYPVQNALQKTPGGGGDLTVTVIKAALDGMMFSTLYGGSGSDNSPRLAIDDGKHIYIYGRTNSTNFPTVKPAQPRFGGGTGDGIVLKITLAPQP